MLEIEDGHCKVFIIIGEKGKRKSMVVANHKGTTQIYGEQPYEITERDTARLVVSNE